MVSGTIFVPDTIFQLVLELQARCGLRRGSIHLPLDREPGEKDRGAGGDDQGDPGNGGPVPFDGSARRLALGGAALRSHLRVALGLCARVGRMAGALALSLRSLQRVGEQPARCGPRRRGLVAACARGAPTQKAHERKFVGFLVFVVGRAGFEPATNGLKVRCSTS